MALSRVRLAAVVAAASAVVAVAAAQAPVAAADGTTLNSPTAAVVPRPGDGVLTGMAAMQEHVSMTVPAAEQASADRATRLSLLADQVRTLVDPATFSGLVVDEAAGTVTIFATALQGKSLGDYAMSAPLGLTVKVSTTGRFTRVGSMAASNTLMGNKSWLDSLGVVMSSVNPDGTGLTIFVSGKAPSASVQKQLESFLGLQGGVTFSEGASPVVDQVATRNADTSPWYSGGRIETTAGLCTAGFDLLKGSLGRLASAHHCDPTDSSWVKSGGGTVIAPAGSSTSDPSIDIELIDPTASPATGPYMYTGAWNSSTKILVKNWATNNIGDSVCQSGATSGARCGVIRQDAVQVPGLTGSFYIRAEANSGWLSAGGDSGGPWYRSVTGGVQARGIHHGGDTVVACGTIDPEAKALGATCTRFSVYVPISVVLSHTGTTLEVG